MLNELAGEVCDEGQATPTCGADCMPNDCGNGVLNESAGERRQLTKMLAAPQAAEHVRPLTRPAGDRRGGDFAGPQLGHRARSPDEGTVVRHSEPEQEDYFWLNRVSRRKLPKSCQSGPVRSTQDVSDNAPQRMYPTDISDGTRRCDQCCLPDDFNPAQPPKEK